MRWIGVLALTSALACASTASSSSPASSSGAQRSDARSCPSGQVAATVERDTDVYASPDSTSAIVGTLNNRARVCADASASGYGFRRVKLPNGRDGFVEDSNVSPM
ncbi:MAG: hypothetical protein ACJ79H_11175 [Myxococcales bacterium]